MSTSAKAVDRWSYHVLSEAAWDTTPILDTLNALVSIARTNGPIPADTLAQLSERINTASSSDFDYLDE